jgi:hypothetical protein
MVNRVSVDGSGTMIAEVPGTMPPPNGFSSLAGSVAVRNITRRASAQKLPARRGTSLSASAAHFEIRLARGGGTKVNSAGSNSTPISSDS